MWRPRLVVLQPTPYCNIDCRYCYLRGRDDRRVMASSVVEAVAGKLLARMARDAAPTLVWHAGEPTVVPLAWYENAYRVLRAAAPPATVFSLQSNGIAISDDWVAFLRRTGTRVGLSIDGPQQFHDARRRTRADGPTWAAAMRGLGRLQAAGIVPNVISVLHPDCLDAADAFFAFYRDHGITQVAFSVDETAGAHASSSFAGADHRDRMSGFLHRLMGLALAGRYPLHIREIERIAGVLAGRQEIDNEQVEPWAVIAVAANGDMTSFSPDFMELAAPSDFRFGNVLRDDIDAVLNGGAVRRVAAEIRAGVEACRATCRYFDICGGGAPINKMAENGSLSSAETSFCRLSIQAAADALLAFLASRKEAPPPFAVGP
jgi:uncharacterized protein